MQLITIAQSMTTSLDSFPMMTIPFFILAGTIMSTGGVARCLVNVFNDCVGHITGGLFMFLLLVGCVMDNIPATTILAPIMLPVAQAAGMTSVQFGVMLTLNLTIGLCTPPYGSDLFIAATISKVKLEDMLKTLWPFLAALFVVLMIVTYMPWVSTILLALEG